MAMTVLSVVNWTLTGVCVALTSGRFAIRGSFWRRLFWDDLVHLISLLVLISHGVTNQMTISANCELKEATLMHASRAERLQIEHHVRYLDTINKCLMYLVFWAVKVGFLLFFRLLFQNTKVFKRVWWGVLGFTILTFCIPIAAVLFTCAHFNSTWQYRRCNAANHVGSVTPEYTCAINVLSALAIMALPFWILETLREQTCKLFGFAFVFSLAVVCILLDVLRTVEGETSIYGIVEINLVVIISCLPTFGAIFDIYHGRAISRYSQHASGSSTTRSERMPINLFSWKRMPDRRQSQAEESNDHVIHIRTERLTIVELDAVQTAKTFEGERDPRKVNPPQGPSQPSVTCAISSRNV